MKNYICPDAGAWTGRSSDSTLYLHEKVTYIDLQKDRLPDASPSGINFALLGYACDEGVTRNLGRPGAAEGPAVIRRVLAKMANHLDTDTRLTDCGDITCEQHNLEAAQHALAGTVTTLLQHHFFPVLLGGGHDMAYGHYKGIAQHLATGTAGRTIGIINFDAHFDLRTFSGQATSGTPFYQIARECADHNFHYLCLGIQRQANIRTLFETAEKLGVKYVPNDEFTLHQLDTIINLVQTFITGMDHIYLTIDLDGFTSAMAPGVSAPSPFGFSYDIAIETLKTICRSGKLISLDIAELNPAYDTDGSTARLAAGLVVTLMSQLQAAR